MQSNRCGNYVLETELLVVSGAPVMLRIPIRRCLLAEQMLTQMNLTDQGREIVPKLTLAIKGHADELVEGNVKNVEYDAEEGTAAGTGAQKETWGENVILRAALGPDLEPIHHAECPVSRCLESCTPAYKSMLQQFGPLAVAEVSDTGCLGPI